jgi:hypothetical protein
LPGKRGIRVLHDYSGGASLVQRLRNLRATGDSMAGLGAAAADFIPTGPAQLEKKASPDISEVEMQHRIRTTLTALRNIGRHLCTLPGSESPIWMTAGLSLPAVLKSPSTPPIPPASAPRPAILPRFLPAGSPPPIQILDAVSAETGVRTFKYANILARIYIQALADARTLYRLGYHAHPLEPIARITPIAGTWESTLRLTVEPGSVTIGETAGRHQGRFGVRPVQTTVESKVLDHVAGEGFNYERKLRIQPGPGTLKFAFCDHAAGRLGSLRVQLPAVAQ